MKRKKVSVALLVFLGIVFLGTLYSKYNQKETIITVGFFSGSNWDVPENESVKILDDAISKFEASHPGVKVKYVSGILKKDYSEWLSGKFLTGNEPDVLLLTPEDFNLFASKDALLSLDTFIKKDLSFKQDAYYEGPLNFGKYEQVQYALPYECMPTLMCVNKSLIKDSGIEFPASDWNWADFHDICRRVTKDVDGDGENDRFGVYHYTWQDAAYSNGALLFNDKGTENYIDSNKVVNAVNYVYALNTLNDGYEVMENDFEQGKVAFCPMSFSEYKTYKSYPWCLEKYTNFDWDCITMPAGPDGSNISELNALLMGISKRTYEKQLAWEFLKMMTYDEEIQNEIFQYAEGVSALKNVTSSEDVNDLLNQDNNSDSISVALLNQVMSQTIAPSRFNRYESALSMLNEGVENAMESEKNIQVALISLQRKINNFLKNG